MRGEKRDRRGRVSWPKKRREELLAEYAGSGMSRAGFARRAGVRYPTFAHGVQEARRGSRGLSGAKERTAAPRFAEVRMGGDGPESMVGAAATGLSVTMPGGLVARGADAAALTALVRALLKRT